MTFRIRDEDNSATLFDFNTTTKIVMNQPSMIEQATFQTTIKPRYGLKSIIKRQIGLTNKQFHVQVVLRGSSRDTDATTLIGILEDNEFIYWDTQGFQTRMDGVYAPTGQFRQKRDQMKQTITVDFDLIEQEDD